MQMEAKNEALKLIARALYELENSQVINEELVKNAIQLLKDAIEKLAI